MKSFWLRSRSLWDVGIAFQWEAQSTHAVLCGSPTELYYNPIQNCLLLARLIHRDKVWWSAEGKHKWGSKQGQQYQIRRLTVENNAIVFPHFVLF